jgi:tRNA(Ile)-lysidine synthetase-like protein
MNTQLVELKNWWLSNSNVWFDSSPKDDAIITNKFYSLSIADINEQSLNLDINAGLGYIILNDQIIRHIVRTNNLSQDLIQEKLQKIISFVKIFYDYNKTKLFKHEFCFTLLPLRHTNIFEYQEFVLSETWNKIDILSNASEFYIYKKYLKATYERMNNKKISKLNLDNICYHDIHSNIEEFIKNFDDIFDNNVNDFTKNNNYQSFQHNNKIINACNQLKKSDKIILSVSGGLDSIVLSWIFYKLKLNFVMLHINYSNRLECEREVRFLSIWAKYIGIELFIRNINEINRPKCMEYELRNIYESYTRDVRYNSYIQTAEQMDWSNYYVVLGHNADDCFENIMTNIASKKNYENLNGMDFISSITFKNNIINFCRPILSISKSDIYEFAHFNNIPYLCDSTPKWSQRGKIRDIVKPTLNTWDSNIINGLLEIKDIIKNSIECVDLLADSWIQKLKVGEHCGNKIIINEKECKFLEIECEKVVDSKIFWDRFLSKLNIKPSSKSLDNLIYKISNIKKNFNSMHLNAVSTIELNHNNKLRYWKNKNNNLIIQL